LRSLLSYLLLKIFQDSKLLKTKIFTDDQISIGSSEGLSLNLPELSPWHLLIEKKENVFSILDLNSETGTFVNGIAITEESLLRSGDKIRVGPYELHFFVGAQQKKKAPLQPTHAGQVSSGQNLSQEHVPQAPQQTQNKATHAGQVPIDQAVAPSQASTPLPGQSELLHQQTLRPPEPAHAEQIHDAMSQSPQASKSVPQQATEPTHAEQTASQTSKPPTQDSKSVPQSPESQEPTYVGQVPIDQPHAPEPTHVTQSPQPNQVSQHNSFPPENLEFSDGYYKVPKPQRKGFWNTYAPTSKVKNLEDIIEPSIGNLIEVNVVWKERVLQTHTFSKAGDIYIGSDKNSQIKFPPMIQQEPYKLMSISTGAQVYLQGAVKGVLIQGQKKATQTTHPLNGNQTLVLRPYEMLKLDFGTELKIYIRLMNKPSKLPFSDLLNLRLSESLALLFAFFMTGLLFFFGTLYAPVFLAKDVDFIEKDIRVAQVVFEKRPEKRKVVKYKMTKKIKRAPIVKKTKKPKQRKRISLKAPVKKTVKKISSPKKGKQGKMSAVAPGKTKTKTKVKLGSARPGGSLKTGKAGSSAKTKASDPSKTGLLAAFGSGGQLAKLDKGASGPGGLTGLANEYTGFGGTKESYEGEGVGTKTKEMASGGKGESLVGASGIKTGGKGLGLVGSGTGGFGQRGRLSMEFSTEDIDVTGEIDREAIARVIRRNRSKFDRCYNQILNNTPSAQGKLKMEWRIAGNGRGTRARALSSGIDSGGLKRCVARVLESLIFPVPPRGQIPEVSFTFAFST